MGRVLGIVYRAIETHLIHQAGQNTFLIGIVFPLPVSIKYVIGADPGFLNEVANIIPLRVGKIFPCFSVSFAHSFCALVASATSIFFT